VWIVRCGHGFVVRARAITVRSASATHRCDRRTAIVYGRALAACTGVSWSFYGKKGVFA
jgi:hypothetical protein